MIRVSEPQARLWTVDEYYKMGELGWFDSQHVELIEGQVIKMSPMGSAHATGVTLAGDTLRQAFGTSYVVRTQLPLRLDCYCEPEPDVAVVLGKTRDYKSAHPTRAVLIVEVADTSLTFDRTEKASVYAKADIPDYWILNLIDRRLEVRRNPVADPSAMHGFSYRDVTILSENDFVTPLAVPQARIAVADLLP